MHIFMIHVCTCKGLFSSLQQKISHSFHINYIGLTSNTLTRDFTDHSILVLYISQNDNFIN